MVARVCESYGCHCGSGEAACSRQPEEVAPGCHEDSQRKPTARHGKSLAMWHHPGTRVHYQRHLT